MGRTLFISDLHFGHGNIIKFDGRPFETLEEMEETLIENWNKAVNKGDTVYILGDFHWSRKPEEVLAILKRLNGDKRLIKGNHDQFIHDKKIKNVFGCYIKDTDLIHVNGKNIVMSHYPIASWKKMQRRDPEENAVLLYGHVHMSDEFRLFEQYLEQLREMKGVPIYAFNTGAMTPWMDFTPRTLEQICDRYERMKGEIDWDTLPNKKPVKQE